MTALKTIRGLAGKGKRLLTTSGTKVLRRLGAVGGEWKSALPGELQYWENALKDGGRNWDANEFRERTNPSFELQQELQELIPAPVGATVRILDVGSGPLTRIGKHWPGRSLEIVAVDPLADGYNSMLQRISLCPLVPARFAHAEKLLEHFEPDSFDLAYASNSLDHSYDPLTAIKQMLAVVKPTHYVYLWHFATVGLAENYSGLHQWNFSLRDGEFTLDDGKNPAQSVNAALAGQADISCELRREFHAPVIVARLRKKPNGTGP